MAKSLIHTPSAPYHRVHHRFSVAIQRNPPVLVSTNVGNAHGFPSLPAPRQIIPVVDKTDEDYDLFCLDHDDVGKLNQGNHIFPHDARCNGCTSVRQSDQAHYDLKFQLGLINTSELLAGLSTTSISDAHSA